MFEKLADLIIATLHLFKFWTVVDVYQRGVRLRFGKHVGGVLEPGLHLQWPFRVDDIWTVDVVPYPTVLDKQGITTTDGKSVTARFGCTWYVEDPVKYLLELENGEQSILDMLHGAGGERLRRMSRDEIFDPGSTEKLLRAVRTRAKELGIAVDRVYFVDLVEAPIVSLMLDHWTPNTGRNESK